jgi:hypothetical protein
LPSGETCWTVSCRHRFINVGALVRAGVGAIKFLFSRINRLQASQNAAALLFDLGTVDIR